MAPDSQYWLRGLESLRRGWDVMTKQSRPRFGALVAAAGAVAAVTATSSAPFATGTLNLRATLRLVSTPVECPPGAPADATECRARTGEGLVAGLGNVSETYTWAYKLGPPICPASVGKPLDTTGRIVIAGKGEIYFALAQGARCIEQEPLRNEPQAFMITGGTGKYEGAAGSGTVERAVSAGFGTETWNGTLVVPGLEFDVTPPTVSGAMSKTLRAPKGAKRVRVSYKVTANDAVDGQVPVTCVPRSGTRLPIGRTVVNCSAADSSGNTGKSSFRITVRARR